MKNNIVVFLFAVLGQYEMLAQGIIPLDPYNYMIGTYIRASAEFNGRLFLGGSIISMEEKTEKDLVIYDDTTFHDVPGFGANVRALCVYRNKLYIASNPSESILEVWNDTALARIPIIAPGNYYRGTFNCMVVYHDKLFIGGRFFYNNKHYALASYDGVSWLFYGEISFTNEIYAIHVWNNKLYVAGQVNKIDDKLLTNYPIASFDGNQFDNLPGSSIEAPNGYINSIIIDNNKLVVGLTKTLSRPEVFAVWDGLDWTIPSFINYNETSNGRVMMADGYPLYLVVGLFDSIKEEFGAIVYLHDNSTYTPVGDSVFYGREWNYPSQLIVQGAIGYKGKIIIHGQFFYYGSNRTRINMAAIMSGTFSTGEEQRLKPLRNDCFPNPTADVLNLTGNCDGEVSITNIYGQSFRLSNHNCVIDVSQLPSGVYFITTYSVGKGTELQCKFIKI